MASRRPGPLHTTPVATRSASDSVARCMICFEPCPGNRSPSGHSTSRSLCRRITIHFHRVFAPLPPIRPGNSATSGPPAWAHNHVRGWTHRLGTTASAAPAGFTRQGTETSPGSRRTRKLPITHYTLVTWFTRETVYSAGARPKTGGVLNCTS